MKIAFLASPKPAAQETLRQFTARYGQADIAAADYLVSIGGDGTALKALRTAMLGSRQPVYAMRLAGSVGFLANEPELADLPGRMQSARKVMLRPLVAEAGDVRGAIRTVYGIKDVVLIRERLQAAKLRLTIQGREPGLRLSGDGLLVATAIGSTGYNRSAVVLGWRLTRRCWQSPASPYVRHSIGRIPSSATAPPSISRSRIRSIVPFAWKRASKTYRALDAFGSSPARISRWHCCLTARACSWCDSPGGGPQCAPHSLSSLLRGFPDFDVALGLDSLGLLGRLTLRTPLSNLASTYRWLTRGGNW